MPYVVLDFETASQVNLKKAGAWRYSEDITTQILCLVWNDNIWFPGNDLTHLAEAARLGNCMFISHGAFEKAIWRNIMVPTYRMPDIPDERWHDTMAQAAMLGLPQDLDKLARVLQIPIEKDMGGRKLTLSMSKLKKGKVNEALLSQDNAVFARIGSYCHTDVQVEAAVHKRLGWMPVEERSVFLLDQAINQRGVRLDMDYVAAAQRVVASARVPLEAEFHNITGGLRPSQGQRFIAWLGEQGVPLANLTKEAVADLLGTDEDEEHEGELFSGGSNSLPGNVHRALSIRKLVGSASIKKLAAMEKCVGFDGRARGLLQYHGATTGRWAGRLLQPQNFPRGTIRIAGKAPDPEALVQAIMTGDDKYVELVIGPPIEAVVSSLRHAIIADPDCRLVVGDFAGIEARIVLALAGADRALETIRKFGSRKAYLEMAGLIFKRPIDKDKDTEEYTIGKNSVLGCGFQMAWETFQRRYAKNLPDEVCKETVRTYREDWAPEVPKLWSALDEASLSVVQDGRPREVYGVEYRRNGNWLTARLPSGRRLWYFNPQLKRKAMPWDPTDIRDCWTYQAMKMGHWQEIYAYGGHEAENVVQGLARDRMVFSMNIAERENMPLIFTSHDELVTEPLVQNADPKMLQQIMEENPPWITDLRCPIQAETWAGYRYKK